MADYYTLLARAVAGLPHSTPETRRSIYDRARNALIGQLRLSDPPALEEDVIRESNSLDEAIARIEAGLRPPAAPLPLPPSPSAALATRPAALVLPAKPSVTAPQIPAPGKSPQPLAPRLPSVAPAPGPATSTAPSEILPGERALRLRKAAPLAPKPPIAVSGISRQRWMVFGGLTALVLGSVAVAAIYLPNPPFDGSKPRLQEPVTVRPTDPKPSKIGDRIGGPPRDPALANPPASQAAPAQAQNSPQAPVAADSQPAIAVAQRAAIVVQVTPEDKQTTNTFIGTVVWRLESASGGAGQPLRNTVRADIDIPEAKITASVVMQDNRDPAFPASHTMKITFNLAPGAQMGTVKAIDVPEMREENSPSGTRLMGLTATIKDNSFLAALAQGDAIVPRNVDLVRSRAWLDVPFQLGTGQFGKLVIEKGPAGERALNDAFAAWGN